MLSTVLSVVLEFSLVTQPGVEILTLVFGAELRERSNF